MGLSRSARGLKQLPGFAVGGLAILQQLQQSITTRLQSIEPGLTNELAALNATLNATAKAITTLVGPHTAYKPAMWMLVSQALPTFEGV